MWRTSAKLTFPLKWARKVLVLLLLLHFRTFVCVRNPFLYFLKDFPFAEVWQQSFKDSNPLFFIWRTVSVVWEIVRFQECDQVIKVGLVLCNNLGSITKIFKSILFFTDISDSSVNIIYGLTVIF